MNIPFYLQLSFAVLTVALLLIIGRSIQVISKKAGAGKRPLADFLIFSLAWLTTSALLGYFEVLADFQALPPRFPIVVIVPMLGILWWFRRPYTRLLLQHTPKHWPILLQSFRIIMELILWGLFIELVIPVQMTFEGLNWDVLSGVFAIPIAFALLRNRLSNRWILAYNMVGLVLLTTIVAIAILSTPSPVRVFMNEPANTMVVHWPMIWLPGFVVPVAYWLHFISIKQLAQSK